jgi:serine/threonine protein kinase
MLYCCIKQHINKPGNIRCVECGSLLAGALIDDYRVVSYVGNGSTSDVYLAEQKSLHQRKVAIKILHRSCGEKHVDNFRREAQLLASLSHPYILPIFSYGVINEPTTAVAKYLPYLVVQFTEQGSLAESFELGGNRPWPLDRVVSLAREVAEALDYAHSRNILHRDVKPANLLQIGSHVLLSDFSVASLIDAEASHLSTGLAGSPAYMAPEVWGMHPGRYSDQYALAVTCFFLLTGNYPLKKNESNNMRGWQHLHCYTIPTSLDVYRTDLSSAVNVVLQKALAKNPHERYPTVQAFALDLLIASQEITQILRKPSEPELYSATRPQPLPATIHTERKELSSVRPLDVSLAYTPVTDAIVLPITPATTVHPSWGKEGKNKPSLLDMYTETPKFYRSSNSWMWCALVLNVLICLVLIAEYTLLERNSSFKTESLLILCPALLVGPLLALLFKRKTSTLLSWSIIWGVIFGITNALLSTSVCLICNSLLFAITFQGSSGVGLNNFFSNLLVFASDPRVIVFMLLAFWMSIVGGAIIGIFNVRDEGEAPVSHQAQQQQSGR